jgi:hypothetical protein
MLTRKVRRYVIALSIVVLLVALYSVAGFWAVPHFLRSGLTDFVGTHYKRSLKLGDIRFNPFTFKLDVSDFSLPDSDGQPMLAFGRLHVDLEVKSLFKLGPSFREIELDRPRIRAVIRANGALNLADLGKGFTPQPKNKPAAKPSEPMRLFIDRFAVTAGSATFEDLSHATPFRAQFQPIAFELSNFSTRAKSRTDNENEYALTAASPQGERLEWNGKFLLEPVSSHGTFAITDLHASTVWSYLQEPLSLEIPSGIVAVKGEYTFNVAGAAPVITVDVHDTSVSNLKLRPRQGETDYVALTKLDVQETHVDVAKRAVEIGKVSLTGGEVNAWLSPQGQLNLLELMGPPAQGGGAQAGGSDASATAAAGPATASASTPPPAAGGAAASGNAAASAGPSWSIAVPDITVDGFKVSAEDRQVTPAVALVLSPLNIHVAGYNTTPTARLEVTARSSFNNGGTLNATAQLAANGSGETTGHLELAQLDLSLFQPYIAQRTAMTLQAGKLATQLEVKKGGDGNVSVKGNVAVTGLRSIDDLQQSFIKWKDLRIAGLQYDLQPASLHIDSITAREPYARVIIAPDRTVNVQVVLAGPNRGAPSLATQLGAANAKRATGITPAASEAAANAKANPPAVEGGAPADAKPETANAGASAASPKGPGADANAPSANANAPGASPQTPGANAQTPSVSAQAPGASPQTAGAAPAVASADKGSKRSRKSRPGSKGAPAAEAPAPVTTMPISIGTVRIIDGSANYADFWIQPNFAVGIQTLNGSIDGLSSDPKSRAKVKLDGKVDRYAPVNIDGEMNLLAASVYSDIKMSFKGLELTTMTPYSGRFAGYKIDKGKLSVDVTYKVDNRVLSADQHFVIDQLQLGERVESPDAVHLPLKLAVALLKDRNGVIDVPLPITGSLDDPQFKIGPIIWHAIVNLLAKVATAPFAALGHLFGGHGGEEMKYVDFTPGNADLDNESKQKLDALTKALHEHTQLQLDVPLVYSSELDRPELAKRRLERQLVARAHGGKQPAPAKSGSGARSKPVSDTKPAAESGAPTGGRAASAPEPGSAVAPTPDARQDQALADPLQHYRLLLAEYQDQLGKDAELPPTALAVQNAKRREDAPPVESAIPELENALIEHIDIPDIALQDLAKRRAQAIQDALLAEGGIEASRVFVINGPAKTENGKVRVEMALK